MSGAPNFLEEEDYDEDYPTAPQARPTIFQTSTREAPEEQTEPKFGEPGFGKGKPNPRRGTPRARITAIDAAYLAFVGLFPGADEEALSVILHRQDSPMGPGGQLPSMSSVKSRITKLKKLGVITAQRHPMTATTSYSLTREGFDVAREFGYPMDSGRTLNGITMERLTHFRLIAHVAAQLISPASFFGDSLGLNPVRLEQLANENEMRAAFQPFREAMREQKKAGQNPDYEALRREVAEEAYERAKRGEIGWNEIIDFYPTLLTLGLSGSAGKAVHQPDLAVKLDGVERQGEAGRNIMVEIELTPKSKPAYEQILATAKAELTAGHAYNQIVYFVVGTAVEKLLRTIDKEQGYGLFASKQLVVIPLCHKDGTPIDLANRIRLF